MTLQAGGAVGVSVAVADGVVRKKMPRCQNGALGIRVAVVTMEMFMPFTESILSYSISGKMIFLHAHRELPRPSNPRDTPRVATRGNACYLAVENSHMLAQRDHPPIFGPCGA